MSTTCALARYLAQQVAADPALELLAPVTLNIVCFRYCGANFNPGTPGDVMLDTLNREIVADVHESGLAAPSTTTIAGKLAIRAAIVNHRTGAVDIDQMLAAVRHFGAARLALSPSTLLEK
jgi:glutamate/tyrosine decarboxylase-like PLP-dependent enzyme